MLTALLIVVLATHLLAANLASAGPLLAAWIDDRAGRRVDAPACDLARRLMRSSMIALGATIALGGAVVGLVAVVSPVPLARAAALIPISRYWFGVAELLFYFVCLVAYEAVARRGAFPRNRGRRAMLWLLMTLAVTDVVYHFTPLFAIIGVYSTRPDSWNGEVRFIAGMFDAEVMAIVVHFLLASLAVSGLAVAWLATNPKDTASLNINSRKSAVFGARVALAATLAQIGSGIWLTAAVPTSARDRMMGDDLLVTVLFALALVAAFALMHRLAALAMDEINGRSVRIAAAWLYAVILLMTAAHQLVRLADYETQGRNKKAAPRVSVGTAKDIRLVQA